MPSPAEYAERPISVEAGREYFAVTGGGDPYAAGLAYPVFLGLMAAYPEELGRDFNEFSAKFGFIPDPDKKGDPLSPPLGFHLTEDPNTQVPWIVGNCQMCHAEKLRLPAGDLVVTGLGNKSVRPHAYLSAFIRIARDKNLDAERLEQLAAGRADLHHVAFSQRPMLVRKSIVGAAISGLKKVAKIRGNYAHRFGDAMPGRMATIESFAAGLSFWLDRPVPTPMPIGWAKVPDVRSFPYRDTFSYDGSGYGSPQALVLEADFLFGVRPEWFASHIHIATSMYMYLRSFERTLHYPGPVDATLAARGKEVFVGTCAGCHGQYVDHGGIMRASYKERVIPKEIVGTDPARVNAVSPEFVKASNDLTLTRGLTAVKNTGGYVPPVLLDVWARGVLGHAGQWPSVAAMALPPAERPQFFVVDPDGMYDLDRLGVRYEDVMVEGTRVYRADPQTGAKTERPLRGREYLYRGDVPGYSTAGHTFLSDLAPDERRAVLEYLKGI
jgi:hypothetical protein